MFLRSIEHHIQRQINLESLEGVIFDVDGTLYNQQKLRAKMLLALLKAFCLQLDAWRIVRVLIAFRRYRESIAHEDIEASLDSQYDWVANKINVKRSVVRQAVEKWMFVQPLTHMRACRYAGVEGFFKKLQDSEKLVGIFSDYPAKEKLAALALKADCYICSTDRDVRRMKPCPDGLLKCCEKMNIDPMRALYIGDRNTLDGACARKADIPYLIVPKGGRAIERFYHHLSSSMKGS